MASDRELLELAAKAAGIPTRVVGATGGAYWIEETKSLHPAWNPLDNDGDALRLAVQLGLEIHQYKSNCEVGVTIYETEKEITEWLGEDFFAATRRAITRAAAAIGKAVP
jgi:hypothetical protein